MESPACRRFPWATVVTASAVGCVVLLLYVLTLAPSITWAFATADSGDLAAAVATWGIPHPTGYPLYVALGGIFAHLLSIGQLALRLNLFSALCSTTTCVLVFLATLQLADQARIGSRGTRYIAAAAAALLLATARTFWVMSIVTEVYALEALFAAVIAYLLTRRATPMRDAGLALVGGLALTHHITILASLLGAVVTLAVRGRGSWPAPRRLATGAALVVLPLSIYALLPFRAAQHPASNWGDPSSLGRLLDVVSGAPYHYLVDTNPGHALRALPAAVRTVIDQFGWWCVPLVVLGVARLKVVDAGFAWNMVIVTLLCLGFLTVYRTPSRGAYLLQAYVLIAVAAGIGIMAIADGVHSVHNKQRRAGPLLVAGALGIVAVVPSLATGLADLNLRNDWGMWRYAQERLRSAPADATIETMSDEETFPLWYAQRAEHLRTDVTIVDVRFRDPLHQR